MRIGIDSRFAVRKRRGIGTYTLKLIQNLALIDSENEYLLYTDRDDSEGILPRTMNFKTKRVSPSNYLLWEQIALPLQARKDSIDVLHCTGNTAPLSMDRRVKLISSIMDVIYLKDYAELPKSESWYQRAGRFYRRLIVPRTVGRISRILTISQFSKDDILQHIPRLDASMIRVIHLSANEIYHTIDRTTARQGVYKRFDVDGNYVLLLGGLDPRKNTELVIKEFIELKNEHHLEEKLLIVGVPNWKQTDFFKVVQQSGFSEDIVFLDFVSEEELALLYNAATVFLYPSLYEGFGIPPLEAMACGVPVITSNTTSIPEVVGDAALLIDPANGEELKSALAKLLDDKGLRDALANRGLEQAKKFSWKKMAEETLDTYEKVYGDMK
jgi:glycosyltransferase involved in cell wall biosynthesis